MRDPFFEEYELKVVARVAAPVLNQNNNLSKELFEAVEEALKKRKDVLVAVTGLTIEPIEKGNTNERSKTGF